MKGPPWLIIFWALVVMSSTLAPVKAGYIGCLFSPTLCIKDVEWCFDDNAFGKCISIYQELPDPYIRNDMSNQAVELFEKEIQRLFDSGYGWEHVYTQCVLQSMLYALHQTMKKYNREECESFKDDDSDDIADVRYAPSISEISLYPQYEDSFKRLIGITRGHDFKLPVDNKLRRETLDKANEYNSPSIIINRNSKKSDNQHPNIINYGHFPYTAEYLTSNKLSPEFLMDIKEKVKADLLFPQYSFSNDDNNEIPESRIYVDDNIADHYYETGSGHPPLADKDRTYKQNIWNIKGMPVSTDEVNFYSEGGRVRLPKQGGIYKLSREDGFNNNYELGFMRMGRLDVKKPGPLPFKDISQLIVNNKQNVTDSMSSSGNIISIKGERKKFNVDPSFTYVIFQKKESLTNWDEGKIIIEKIRKLLNLESNAFSHPRVNISEVTFKVEPNSRGMDAKAVAQSIYAIQGKIFDELGVRIIETGIGDFEKDEVVKVPVEDISHQKANIIIMSVVGSVVTIIAVIALIVLIKKDNLARRKFASLITASQIDAEATRDYQDLCRARISGKWNTTTSTSGPETPQRITSLSKEPDGSPSARSSTSSWSEEPALTNMDISTGHMVLAYMEDHLKNKDRLDQEWKGLCAYEAEPSATVTANKEENLKKNRYPDIVPYDHSRVVLSNISNQNDSDYINASSITDHDPRNPAYIAAQGPLENTAADFWQMIWEQGSVVTVMLTRLNENGNTLCYRYWPEEGSQVYHIYEVHLVSEHIWCDDYLVRSFYLKNQKSGETRTVTQFHFLSWPDNGVPSSTKALLEFRRKVNKSYRGRSCPIVVHCSDGAGRSGTYCLIDMVLNRMAKGAKEIDIAATLEHIRDQRPYMVATKQQFEFVLMAVAEEVHAILKALPAQLQQQHEKKEKDAAEKELK